MIRDVCSGVLSKVWRLLAFTLVAGCGELHRRPPPTDDPPSASGVLDGRAVRIGFAGELISRIDPVPADHASNRVLWPPIIDSHVHVTYWPVADKLGARGISTVVDLAAPESAFATKFPIRVISAGPMLTRPDGYPLDSWGADGYGVGCADAACVTSAIDRARSKGARIVKIALGDNGLDPALVPVAISHAHGNKMKVAVHALDDASARLAGTAGADLLAHTPIEPLAAVTIAAWRGKAVISTLAAFDAPSSAAVDNLAKLRAAGCTVLYGTDLGNLRDAGPSAAEIKLLRRAGLDDAAITAAMTTAPAAYWGIPLITVGQEASFLLLGGDPRQDASYLLEPSKVWLRGRAVL